MKSKNKHFAVFFGFDILKVSRDILQVCREILNPAKYRKKVSRDIL